MAHQTEFETCDECQFVSTDYTRDDLRGTLRALAPMWRTTIGGIDEAVLHQRPAPEVWSAIEYVAHSRDTLAGLALMAGLALEMDAPHLEGDPPSPDGIAAPDTPATIAAAIDELDGAVGQLRSCIDDLDDSGWSRRLSWGDRVHDVTWMVGHAVHDATHHLKDVGRGIHALGAGAPSHSGHVAQINTSDGGVPKTPVAVAEVGRSGLVGDRQDNRLHHGRPLQALCLWSDEVIGSLRGEGHPITPGLAGENLTLRGIDWSTIRPGVRLLVGDATIEISAWSTPCAKNAPWFVDGDFNRMSHERHPGWSRAYAWVLEGGTVRADDEVIVEP